MKKLAVAAGLLVACLVSQAKADVAFPLWGCHLKANVTNKSFSVFLGVVNIDGHGVIDCRTAAGQRVQKNVVISMNGVSLGPIVAFPDGQRGSMAIHSGAIGLSHVDAIYGAYSIEAGAGLQIGDHHAGIRRVVSVTPKRKGGISTGFKLAFVHNGTVGLGFNVHVSGMRIMTLNQAASKHRFQQEFTFEHPEFALETE